MKHEQEIRKVIELQKQIKEMQAEVSQILNEVIDHGAKIGVKFVVDGQLWEVDRWPREATVTKNYFSAWRLQYHGEVIQ